MKRVRNVVYNAPANMNAATERLGASDPAQAAQGDPGCPVGHARAACKDGPTSGLKTNTGTAASEAPYFAYKALKHKDNLHIFRIV